MYHYQVNKGLITISVKFEILEIPCTFMAHIHSMPPTHYTHYYGTLQHALYTHIPTNLNLSSHTKTIDWY